MFFSVLLLKGLRDQKILEGQVMKRSEAKPAESPNTQKGYPQQPGLRLMERDEKGEAETREPSKPKAQDSKT